jgi:hypothetical protein
MQAVPAAVHGAAPITGILPAMERFSKRKRHHSPIGRLLAQAEDMREMGRSISNCANALQVLLQLPEGADPFAMLTGYNPCNRRACPMCEWRRSMVWRGKLLSGLDEFWKQWPTHRAIFATFTVKNVPLVELGETIKQMHRSWHRMVRTEFFPTPFWFRRTEVTVKHLHSPLEQTRRNADVKELSQIKPSQGWGPVMAHPHIHALLLVPASYFGKNYVKSTEWQSQWMMAARLDYVPVVDIRRATAKGTSNGAIEDAKAAGIEAMKYAVKATDMRSLQADLPEFVRQMRNHRLVGISSQLGSFVPDVEPTADQMADDRQLGLVAQHPGVSCLAQWDQAVSNYVLTPRT